MTGETAQAIAAFALAAIPGVLVLEILEYGRPRLRDRSGIRAFASYLILSLVVWSVATVCLDAGGRLAAVVDVADAAGQIRVDAYSALAWRLLVTSVAVGLLARIGLWLAGLLARKVEAVRRAGEPRAYKWLGDVLTQLVSISFGWDRLLERLRQAGQPQIVHVRFRDGSEMYGVLAAGGSADFQADGRGLVLDAELIEVDGQLQEVPGSSGAFVSGDAVASVAFVEYTAPPADPASI
ncbi:MAG TPA: hypothetical protein VMT37_08855 [Solirubrobacterales bacterium]|nr:hypothetical protein [Solirubrobacterales bacterium]